jgi:hypothetical protein
MKEFWENYAQYVDKHGKFDEKVLPLVVKYLSTFDKYFAQLKMKLRFKPT